MPDGCMSRISKSAPTGSGKSKRYQRFELTCSGTAGHPPEVHWARGATGRTSWDASGVVVEAAPNTIWAVGDECELIPPDLTDHEIWAMERRGERRK